MEAPDSQILDFLARISWPAVVLIGILILGPGKVLQNLIGELAGKLFQITSAVDAFRKNTTEFQTTVDDLKGASGWVSDLEARLDAISTKLETISTTTEQLAISEGTRSLAAVVSSDRGEPPAAVGETLSAEEMFDEIRRRWGGLTDLLKAKIGDSFDARSVGQMAWKLVDRRRVHPIASADAELIERLHAQIKRFNRLQRTKEEWLTHDTYASFIRGIEQAEGALG